MSEFRVCPDCDQRVTVLDWERHHVGNWYVLPSCSVLREQKAEERRETFKERYVIGWS